MAKFTRILIITLSVLSACRRTTSKVPSPASPTAEPVTIPTLATRTTITQPPVITPPTSPIPRGAPDRPVFLAWPLPAWVGTARISQYPNSAWTWNYLGLNPGYQCPPMFGYLDDLSSLPYWRDTSIPEAQDRAQADPHQFEMVECYFAEGMAGANGHEGTDIKAPAGTPVFAAADGIVQEWRAEGLYAYVVLNHCIGGAWDEEHQCVGGRKWYTTYMHIVPDPAVLEEKHAVAQGAPLGTIYDQTINSHLHFEVGLDKRAYANFRNPWGMDRAPWLGCMWLDQSICPFPEPDYKRMAYLTRDDRLFLKQGERESVSIAAGQEIKRMRLWGDRVAVLDAENRLFIRAGEIARADDFDGQTSANGNWAGWMPAAENVLEVQITDHRTAILDANRTLLLWNRNPGSFWVLYAGDVRAFSLSEQRVGFLNDEGELFVKEGSPEKAWIPIAHDVLAFQVTDNRIAFIDRGRNLWVNEGEMQSEFQQMASNVRAFQITNVRIGMIDGNNRLLVKEGNLRASWVEQAEQVRSFQLADYRMVMQDEDGQFWFKEGGIYQEWVEMPSAELKNVMMNGNLPIYLSK